jgi:hypothetical protein
MSHILLSRVKIVMCFLISIFTIHAVSAEGTPYQKDGMLIFPLGGTSIPITEGDVSSIAQKTEGKGPDIYHIFTNPQRVVIVNSYIFPNFSEISISFYDFRGNKIGKSEKIDGEFRFFFP